MYKSERNVDSASFAEIFGETHQSSRRHIFSNPFLWNIAH